MKKNLLTFILLFLTGLGPAQAYDFSAVAPSGQTLYYNIVNGNAQVTYQNSSSPRYTSLSGSLTIPATVTYGSTTYSVTSIGDTAFYGCSGLTSVTIPNSVTSIGNYAFSGCSGLTMTNYTGTLAQWCNINFSNSSSNPAYYSHNLYINGTAVTQLVIPNGVTEIKQYAFYSCSSLTSVTIPNSVTSIGSSAFNNCSGLTTTNYTGILAQWCNTNFSNITSNPAVYSENLYINGTEVTQLVIPNGVTEIKQYAFCDCSGLTGTLTIPNSVTSIGNYAFRNCSGLTGTLTIPDSVTSIGEYAFYDCSGLTSVTIGNSVDRIGQAVFSGCSGLTGTLTIPNSVTSIGYYAFQSCSGLTSVTIGSSVTSIGHSAFSGCSGLTSITSLASVAPTLGTNVFSGVSSTIPINTPCGSTMFYYSRWIYFSNFIEAAGYSFRAVTADSTMGSVTILTQPTCQAPTAVFNAIANPGFRFDHWSDGNTTNPRSLVVTQETVITAYFEASSDTVFIHDTIYIYDTVNNYNYDTVIITRYYHDTVIINNYIYDTIYLNRYIFDTIYIHDTIYVGGNAIGDVMTIDAKIYAHDGQIVVEGAEGMPVMLYDATGRLLATRRSEETFGSTPVQFNVPVSGTYLVRVGNLPAKKVVVIR